MRKNIITMDDPDGFKEIGRQHSISSIGKRNKKQKASTLTGYAKINNDNKQVMNVKPKENNLDFIKREKFQINYPPSSIQKQTPITLKQKTINPQIPQERNVSNILEQKKNQQLLMMSKSEVNKSNYYVVGQRDSSKYNQNKQQLYLNQQMRQSQNKQRNSYVSNDNGNSKKVSNMQPKFQIFNVIQQNDKINHSKGSWYAQPIINNQQKNKSKHIPTTKQQVKNNDSKINNKFQQSIVKQIKYHQQVSEPAKQHFVITKAIQQKDKRRKIFQMKSESYLHNNSNLTNINQIQQNKTISSKNQRTPFKITFNQPAKPLTSPVITTQQNSQNKQQKLKLQQKYKILTDIEQKDSSGKHMKVDLPMKNVVFEDNVSDNKQGCFGGFISFCI